MDNKQGISEVKSRNFIIKDDEGTIEMQESIENTITMSSRDFLTFYREHQKAIENIDEALSEQQRDKLLQQKEKVQSLMRQMKDVVDESDKLFTEAQKRKILVDKANLLRHFLNNKEPDSVTIKRILDNEDNKDGLLSNLTDEERIKLAKLKFKK